MQGITGRLAFLSSSSSSAIDSNDSIESKTPKKQPRIIAPESRPVVPSSTTSIKSSNQQSRPSMSENRFQSAMNGSRTSTVKSQFFAPPATSKPASNGLYSEKSVASSKRPEPSADSRKRSEFASSLEKFRYGSQPRTVSSASSDADAAGSEDDDNPKPAPKKRRLVRGGGGGRTSDNDDRESTSNAPTSPPPTKPERPSTTAKPPVTVKPKLSVAEELERRAGRIMMLHPSFNKAQVLAVLKKTLGDTRKTIEIMKEARLKGSPSPALTPTKVTPVPMPKPKPAAPTPASAKEVVEISDDEQPSDAKKGKEVLEISSDEEDEDRVDRVHKEDSAAVNWFNKADVNALMDTTNCSQTQAETIISLRPFKSAYDVENKLGDKAAKGVTPRIFTQCKELMAGYYEVDAVLERCEKIGRDLNAAMSSWYPEDRGSRRTSPAGGASREGTPSGTLNLSSVKKGGAVMDHHYLEHQPKLLSKNVTLKEYQLVGVNWLNLLYRKRTSAILADEMGLGKTAQVISFFAYLKERGVKGPHLVVAPSSVLENWDREFRFFAPSINVRRYYGNQKDRFALRKELSEDSGVEVILTTYDMAAGGPQDHKFLRKFGFKVCVFDEGHILKNRKSQKYEKLVRIKAEWRLLLTGTPLQNNLQELVSLLNFIMPQYFSEAEEALAAIFKVKTGGQQNQLSKQRVDRAKKMMQPFVLRRLKDKVLTDLTTKTVTVEYCDMTPVQKKIYAQAVARSRAAALGQADPSAAPRAASRTRGGTAGGRDSGHVLMELRKAANHPLLTRRLFDEKKIDTMARDLMKEPDYADANFEHVKEDLAINTDAQLSFSANSYPATRKHVLPEKEWMNAGKIKALERLIPEIKAKGDRILIFSQFTMVLDILCVCLENMGIKYVGFTGATQVEDRQILVDQFTNDAEITVFLLSTKAGGLGINLIAANWVILFDQDFNPQNDKQAADRSYRMGQKKPVTVIKLICRGTIDEDIHKLGTRKLELAERVSGEDEMESDQAEQQKTAQTLLAQLRHRTLEEVQDE